MQESYRVLICEASEIVAAGVVHSLQNSDMLQVVGIATSFEQLMQLMREKDPHVVVLEPELPDMQGFEAIETLRLEFPDVNILVLSTVADEDTVCGAFIAGANGYCLKNVFSSYLCSAVYSVGCGAAWLDRQISGLVLPRPDRRWTTRSAPALKLSDRETQVLQLLAEGLSNKEIAARLYLSQTTVKTYLRTLFRKLGVADRSEAAARAARQGILRSS